MQVKRQTELHPAHIADVREVVLHARSGARHPRVVRGNARQHHSVHDRRNRGLVALCNAFQIVHARLQTLVDQARNRLAIVLAVDDVRNAPLGNADVLRQHIAQTRKDHPHRRGGEDVKVSDHRIRHAAVQRHLEAVADGGRRCGSVTVHRRRSPENDILAVRQVRNDLADVVDNARADTENEVAGVVKVHCNRPDRVLVRLDPLRSGQAVDRAGNPRVREDLCHLLACGGVGVMIRQQKDLFRAVGAHDLGNAADCARFDDDMGKARLMGLSARALNPFWVIQQFLQFRHKNSFSPRNVLTRRLVYAIIIAENAQIIKPRRKS